MRRLLIPAVVASLALVAAFMSGELRWWFVGGAIAVTVGSLLSYFPPRERRNALLSAAFALLAFAPIHFATRRFMGRPVDVAEDLELLAFGVVSAIVMAATTLLVSRAAGRENRRA